MRKHGVRCVQPTKTEPNLQRVAAACKPLPSRPPRRPARYERAMAEGRELYDVDDGPLLRKRRLVMTMCTVQVRARASASASARCWGERRCTW